MMLFVSWLVSSFTLTLAQPGVYECAVDEWSDVLRDCGSSTNCRVLTDSVQKYWTCDAYCAEQEGSLACVAAWEDFDDSCQIFDDDVVQCWTNFSQYGTSDMICECSDFSEEEDQCVTDDWDWDYEWYYDSVYCGSCKVYTPAVEEYWSCDYYCAYQEDGHACSRAWLPTFEYGCGGVEMECDTDFNDMNAEAMICECDHEQEPNWAALFEVETQKSGRGALLGVSICLMLLVCASLGYQGYKVKEETYGEKPMKEIIQEWRENRMAAKKETMSPTKGGEKKWTGLRKRTPSKKIEDEEQQFNSTSNTEEDGGRRGRDELCSDGPR